MLAGSSRKAVARRRRVAEMSVGDARAVRFAFAMNAFAKTEPFWGRVMFTKGSAWT